MIEIFQSFKNQRKLCNLKKPHLSTLNSFLSFKAKELAIAGHALDGNLWRHFMVGVIEE